MTEVFKNYDFTDTPCTSDWVIGSENKSGATSSASVSCIGGSAVRLSAYTETKGGWANIQLCQTVDLRCVTNLTFSYNIGIERESGDTLKFEVRLSAPGKSPLTQINWTNPYGAGTQSFDIPSDYRVENVTVCLYVSVYKSFADFWAVYINADIGYVTGTASYTAPTIASATVDTTSGTVPLTVQFDSTVTAGCPTGVTREWTIQKKDGLSWIPHESGISASTFSRTFTSPGTYRGSLVASNEKVSSSATLTNEIDIAGIAPISAFTADKVLAPTNSTIQFVDISAYSPTSWEWKYRKDGSGGYVNFTNHTSQNPKQVFPSEGNYDISLKVTNDWGEDTETKLEYIRVDDTILVGTYPYKGSNEYGILLMNGASHDHLVYHKGKTAAILGMKVTRSEGDTSVAEFTLTATQRMGNEDSLLKTGTHVYVLHYDWVSFSGIISKVENNTIDVYESTIDPLRKIKVTCEGATSLLKREFIGSEDVITDTPGKIFKEILSNSGSSHLEGKVQTDSVGTQKRQFSIVKGTTFDSVSNLCDSTGYRIYDEPEGQYLRGVFTDYSTGVIQFVSSDTVNNVAVNDYLIYLKRDATATGYGATDPNNTLARFRVAGRVSYVSGDTIRITADTPMASFGGDEPYVKYGVALIIKDDGLRVGFTLDDDTNIEPLLDIGKMVLDSNLVDTDYINATVYNCTTVNQGKKTSVTLPACVKVDSNGIGDSFTFISQYHCGTHLIDHYIDDDAGTGVVVLYGHKLFDPTDPPDKMCVAWMKKDNTLMYVNIPESGSHTWASYYREGYQNGIPVTVFEQSGLKGATFTKVETFPKGAFVKFSWNSDDIVSVPQDKRVYLSDVSGISTTDMVGIGSLKQKVLIDAVDTTDKYVFIKDNLNTFESMITPKFVGCIIYKETNNGDIYTKGDPEIGSPIDQRGVITQTITCAQGSTIPELEVIASSYVVSKGVFADIGEGRIPSRYAYSSTYPIPLEVDYTINKPIIDGTMVKVRFNDETRDYRVAKATYDYMKYMATFEFGGKKRDIPDSVKSVMSVTNTTG